MNKYMNKSEIADRLNDYNDGELNIPYLPYKKKYSPTYYNNPVVRAMMDEYENSLPEWMKYEW